MLYNFVKIFARLALPIYCRDIKINKRALLHTNDGPVLLAVNHPNSFLDAIILCTLFNTPLFSLARGDAFKQKKISRLLTALKLLPVYRVSEGVENLEENYKTFEACKDIFRQNGMVLIFSEGRCINEWHLRPLKKGTARLAISSWEDGIPLKVLPVGINYNSFSKFGKNVQLFFGEYITADIVATDNGHGRSIQAFNENLRKQLQPFVQEIEATDKQTLHKIFYVPQPILKKMLLFFPSLLGWLLHAPIYYPVKNFVIKKSKETDHYDSAMLAIFFLLYPIYLLLLTGMLLLVTQHWTGLFTIIFLPFTAWAHVQLKKQF